MPPGRTSAGRVAACPGSIRPMAPSLLRRPCALAATLALLGPACSTLDPVPAPSDPGPSTGFAPTTEERAELLDLVQRTFDAIRDGDSTRWSELLLEEGAFTSWSSARREARVTTFEDLRSREAGPSGRYLERCWDARILVEGDLAMIWTPYDFHIDGAFSHSGIDLFSLLRTPAGWRVASITYTVDPEQRPDNPLAPPTP